MTEEMIRYFALVSASNARVAGLIAENEAAKQYCRHIPNTEEDFYEEAGKLEAYAHEVMQR